MLGNRRDGSGVLDLQWGDVDSAALIQELLQPPDPPPLLLVASYRSEDALSPLVAALRDSQASRDRDVDVHEIAVGALSPAEAREVALVRHVTTGQALAWSAPDSTLKLDDVLYARVALLPKNARRLLEIIAVAGKPLPRLVAASAAELEGEQEITALAFLRTGRLVRSLRTQELRRRDVPRSDPRNRRGPGSTSRRARSITFESPVPSSRGETRTPKPSRRTFVKEGSSARLRSSQPRPRRRPWTPSRSTARPCCGDGRWSSRISRQRRRAPSGGSSARRWRTPEGGGRRRRPTLPRYQGHRPESASSCAGAPRSNSCDAGVWSKVHAPSRTSWRRSGDEGRGMVEEADATFRAQGARAPARYAAMLAPGFSSASES